METTSDVLHCSPSRDCGQRLILQSEVSVPNPRSDQFNVFSAQGRTTRFEVVDYICLDLKIKALEADKIIFT